MFYFSKSAIYCVNNINLSEDKIRLDEDIFSALSSIEAENFVSGAGATALEADDYLIFNTTNNFLYFATGISIKNKDKNYIEFEKNKWIKKKDIKKINHKEKNFLKI